MWHFICIWLSKCCIHTLFLAICIEYIFAYAFYSIIQNVISKSKAKYIFKYRFFFRSAYFFVPLKHTQVHFDVPCHYMARSNLAEKCNWWAFHERLFKVPDGNHSKIQKTNSLLAQLSPKAAVSYYSSQPTTASSHPKTTQGNSWYLPMGKTEVVSSRVGLIVRPAQIRIQFPQ